MKFLTISSMRDVFLTLPPAVSRQLLEASLAWMNQKKKEGVVLEVYELAGCNRYATICEHNSAEDLIQTLSTAPTNVFMNHDIHALSDFNVSMKAYIEAAKAAEKMMSGAPK
jgi:muconolactone delta-isomerase